MPQFPGGYAPNMQQQRTQIMNGVGDDMDKKTLMHTAIVNNGRKVSRPGQHPMPMQQQNLQQNTNHAQLNSIRQQQQQQQQQQHQQQQQQQLQLQAPLS